jgi:iron-regulated transporter 1
VNLAPGYEATTAATGAVLEKARRLLYVSHFFAQFSEVAWQFSLILFLAAIAHYKSLALVSTYGLASGLSVCLLGSTAGRFVDGADRLVAAQFFIWTENLSVLVATAFCYRLLLQAEWEENPDAGRDPPMSLVFDDSSSASASWLESAFPHVPLDAQSLVCLAGIHFFGSVAQILDRGFLVAIERDWVVIMSQTATARTAPDRDNSTAPSPESSDPTSPDSAREHHQQRQAAKKSWLSETNVCMKQIDLSCKVVAPAIAGLIIGAFDTTQGQAQGGGADDPAYAPASQADSGRQYGNNLKGAALLVGVVNVIALVVEYHCTRQIYRMVPGLAVKRDTDDSVSSLLQHHRDPRHDVASLPSRGAFLPLARGMTGGGGIVESWAIVQEPWRLPPAIRIYLDQPVSKAGLSLAILYVSPPLVRYTSFHVGIAL